MFGRTTDRSSDRNIKRMQKSRIKRPENNRPKMNITDRAKQFAPFAALGKMDQEFAYIERQVNIGELEHLTEWSDLSAEFLEEGGDAPADRKEMTGHGNI